MLPKPGPLIDREAARHNCTSRFVGHRVVGHTVRLKFPDQRKRRPTSRDAEDVLETRGGQLARKLFQEILQGSGRQLLNKPAAGKLQHMTQRVRAIATDVRSDHEIRMPARVFD